MSDALKRSLLTAAKYIFWTALAAAIQSAINTLPKVELPVWVVPIIGVALKSAATYVATAAEGQ